MINNSALDNSCSENLTNPSERLPSASIAIPFCIVTTQHHLKHLSSPSPGRVLLSLSSPSASISVIPECFYLCHPRVLLSLSSPSASIGDMVFKTTPTRVKKGGCSHCVGNRRIFCKNASMTQNLFTVKNGPPALQVHPCRWP